MLSLAALNKTFINKYPLSHKSLASIAHDQCIHKSRRYRNQKVVKADPVSGSDGHGPVGPRASPSQPQPGPARGSVLVKILNSYVLGPS